MSGSAERFGRYSRQSLLPQIGIPGQEKLKKARVAVLGCGALGSACAELLVRAGVGFVRVVDRDIVELSNLQRQHLFEEADVEAHAPKARAAAARLARINSEVQVEGVVEDVRASNIESFIQGMDLVMDGLDNFETRYLLNDACVKLGIPWFYGAVQGTRALAMPVIPGEGPCLRCVFPDAPAPGTVPTCNRTGVLGAAVSVTASMQTSAALRWLVSGVQDPGAYRVRLQQHDVWEENRLELSPTRSLDCPCCSSCEFPWLSQEVATHTRVLCGRSAIQISPAAETRLDLSALAQSLKGSVAVVLKDELLEITENDLRLVLFQSGRAIVHGTTEESKARAMVSKYLA